jgi:archaemetzincin
MDEDLTGYILRHLVNQFGVEVSVEAYDLDISAYYNPVRRQYDANGLLGLVSGLADPRVLRTVGLFKVDIFIPILTYIFGQAGLNGNTGIASVYRLRNELYGLAKDNALLMERFSKVILHELGHTFGLIHCHNPVCIMRSSTYVEDIDQKEGRFCRSCRMKLEEHRDLQTAH